MGAQVFDVFQHESLRLIVIDDLGEVEEQVALLFVIKAVLASKAQFLRDAGDAERLAREAGAKDIMRRYLIVSK